MNYKNILTLTIFTVFINLITVNAYSHDHSNCEAAPYIIEITQEDGSVISITGKGTMLSSYTETIDGYTIVLNEKGIYEYAELTQEGRIQASGIRAQDPEKRQVQELEFLQSHPHHLRITISDENQIFHKDFDEPDFSEIPSSFPTKGQRRVLLLMIEYPDLPSTYSVEDFDSLMNQDNYNGTGSFREFFYENSYGQLDLQIDVFGWYMAKENYQYYGSQHGSSRARNLVAEAVDAAYAAGVDFSLYDNTGDGEVEGILVVHSGPGAEEGSQTQYVWSHRWRLNGGNGSAKVIDGIRINNYAINPETRGGNNKRLVGIGIFCHEFGHVLGLPDLYDTKQITNGIGEWGVMGSGGWLDQEKSPANFTPWSRIDLEWVEPLVLEENGEYKLSAVTQTDTIFRINTPLEGEYFLLENRQRESFDRALRGNGLAIWQINDDYVKQYRTSPTSNQVNANYGQHGVKLIQADGRNDLENRTNRGDGTDLYPNTFINANNAFTHSSNPQAVLSNGELAGFSVLDIKQINGIVSFYYGLAPIAQFFNTPSMICEGNLIQFYNQSQHKSSYVWYFGDGDTSTEVSPLHFYNKAGNYEVVLKATDESGLEVSYDTSFIIVEPIPVAKFEYTIKEDNTIQFKNLSEDAANYSWNFGSENNNFDFEPKVKIENIIDNTVLLNVSNNTGCSDTYIATIYRNDISEFNLFPNPFSNKLNLSFHANEDVQIEIEVFNVHGQKLISISEDLNNEQGMYLENITEIFNSIPQGTYVVSIKIDEEDHYRELLVKTE